jgi:site-specific DNA recombinase
MSKLDDLIIESVKDRLFKPERLRVILETLIERQGAKDEAVDDRRAALERELSGKEEKLTRLYCAIENGIVDLDAQLKDRIATIKTERDIVRTSLDRLTARVRASSAITPDRLEAFAKAIGEKLASGDVHARKAYLRSVISHIEVDDDKVRIVGDKATLAAAIAGRQIQSGNVRGFVRKWRTGRDSNPSLSWF